MLYRGQDEKEYQALLNAIPDVIFELDGGGRFISCTKSRREQLFRPFEELVGQQLSNVLPPKLAKEFQDRIDRVLTNGEMEIFEFSLPLNGEISYQEARIVAMDVNEVLMICRDVTDRVKYEIKLKYLGFHDQLTGLYNRNYFNSAVEQLLKSPHYPLGLLVCDVDGLKIINDSLGHQAGDKLLLAATRVLTESSPPDGVLARFGGDEFVMLAPDCDEAKLQQICQRINRGIKAYNDQRRGFSLGLSIGYAVGTERLEDLKPLFKVADENMYEAKERSPKNTRNAVAHVMFELLKARDFVTEKHAKRMQDMISSVASRAGIGSERIVNLRLLAYFHDVGKVCIPDSILLKPGPLDGDERKIMQSHVEIGRRIMNSISDLSQISEWILRHHEWWNGQGYPLGLKGEEIPVECRLLAIVDAYDAMISDRPYRQAMSKEEAVAELRRCAGTQFDPWLVEKFIATLNSGSATGA